LPRPAPLGRGPLVPGLLRARRRLRPGRAQHARRAPGRRLRRERPEGVDQLRRRRRLVLPPLPHRARGAEAPWYQPAPGRHEEPGHHRAPLEADHGRGGVLGGFLRGRARAGRDDGGRARRRLADRDGHPRARARAGVDLHLPAHDPAEPRAPAQRRARASRRPAGARPPGAPPAAPAGAPPGAGARGRPSEPSPLRRWLAPPFTAFIFLIHPLLAIYRPGGLLQDPGTGWHLVTGRLILDTGSIPARDPFSYTAAGHEWINLAWL